MSVSDVRAVLEDENAFLAVVRAAADGYHPKTEIGAKIKEGWLGTFGALAKENEGFMPLDQGGLSKSLSTERTQIVALRCAILDGHPDEASWEAFFSEDIAIIDELKALLYK
jgi:hypothetical protein